MVEVVFHKCDYIEDVTPTYVIIGARYNGKWVFVKSRKRGSYELPAGHIDAEESVFEAAGRELIEETGALKFILECVSVYSVQTEKSRQLGKLYYADILEIGDIIDVDEIEDRVFQSDLPENLTFPDVQEKLFSRLVNYVN